MSINFGTETAQSLLNHRYLRGLKIKKAIIDDNKIRAVEHSCFNLSSKLSLEQLAGCMDDLCTFHLKRSIQNFDKHQRCKTLHF